MGCKQTGLAMIASVAALVASGCNPLVPPIRYLVFVDVSGSIAPDQRLRWTSQLGSLVDVIEPGDEITVYPIRKNTLGGAELFSGRTKSLPPDPTLDEAITAKRELSEIKRQILDVLESALQPAVPARQTDVLSAFDRYRDAPGYQKTVILIVSDMLNCTSELDLERKHLEPHSIPALLQGLAQAHNWKPVSLHGAEIHCLLNDQADSSAEGANDRRVLETFYRSLVESLGGTLASFDTRLEPGFPGRIAS